jgi:hypothetical protein
VSLSPRPLLPPARLPPLAAPAEAEPILRTFCLSRPDFTATPGFCVLAPLLRFRSPPSASPACLRFPSPPLLLPCPLYRSRFSSRAFLALSAE